MSENMQQQPAVLTIQQQLAILNARVQNANLAFNDLLREMSLLIKTCMDKIADLEKENAELKKGEKKK